VGLRQGVQRFLECALFRGFPMSSEYGQRLRVAQAFTAWLRSRHAQAITQGV